MSSPRSSPRLLRKSYTDLNNLDSNPSIDHCNQQYLLPPLIQVQKQVDEVTSILSDNIRGILDREGKLNDLASRARTVSESSKIFEKTTHKVKESFWKLNRNVILCACLLSFLFALVSAGILYGYLKGW